jgi:hypothetical protein
MNEQALRYLIAKVKVGKPPGFRAKDGCAWSDRADGEPDAHTLRCSAGAA